MASKSVFTSVFHSLLFHFIIKHIFCLLFLSTICGYQSSILFALRDIVIAIVVRVVAVVRKNVLLSFLKKHDFKFWPVFTTTNKALVIILWYSEWINGYDKNFSHMKLLSLALKGRKFEPFSFFIYQINNEELVNINKVSTIVPVSIM